MAGPDSWHGLHRGFRDLPRVRSVGGAPQEVLGEESKHTEEISVSRETEKIFVRETKIFVSGSHSIRMASSKHYKEKEPKF